jgi:hypothetical protein
LRSKEPVVSESRDRRQETGDRRQEIIFIYSSHFPTSPLPYFPTSPLPHFPTSPLPHFIIYNSPSPIPFKQDLDPKIVTIEV